MLWRVLRLLLRWILRLLLIWQLLLLWGLSVGWNALISVL